MDNTSKNTVGADESGEYEPMSLSQPDDDIYEPVSPRVSPVLKQPAEDPLGYLLPVYPDGEASCGTFSKKTTEKISTSDVASRTGVVSVYEDLWAYTKQNNATIDNECHPLMGNHNDNGPIYDEVNSCIPSNLPPGARLISVEEPVSAYDEVIINDGRYLIPSRQWDSDSETMESDFDEDSEAPNYFGENLDELYENLENRKLASPTPTTMPFGVVFDEDGTLQSRGGLLDSCIPIPKFAKTSKALEKSNEELDPLYVDANSLGEKEPVMPPFSLELSTEEATRYEIVNKILDCEAAYKQNLCQLVQIEEECRGHQLLESESLDVIFCSLQSILQCHEMFSIVLAARMNEWTVDGQLGDIICASFSKSTTTMAYTDFVNNFLAAIDTYKASCKTNNVFSQYMQAKLSSFKPKTSFHDLMLKPFARFSEFIILIQDLLEVTPVGHMDRVHLQLALTHLECLAELINSRRKECEMKSQLKYLDSQISQLSKPLSSPGRVFIRQDDMIHCLIDGVSVVGTKKLRLVLLSDMLLCLSPVGKKKRLVPALMNTPKYKFKLKWNVPLSDVQFVEYGAGVSVAAGKYGTTTTYCDQGKYRQATTEIQKHIEDLQHDLAVIGQIAGLASSLRGKHQFLDQRKAEMWHKSVENTITEELKTVNMFWLELSLPTKSGQHNYVFNLSSPTVKEEWQADAMNAKLALESRNNPGWYLPEDDITGSLSILRRNMPLLAEYFDLFVFNAKSRVEHMITYPIDALKTSTAMASRGLGHYVWISARGEMQGHVSLLRFETNGCVPRFLESFNVCPGTVYSMAHIPAMNSRSDQSANKYHTKYGFPFPTVWLGSHSSRIYIYDAESDDRSRPLMELKLRDAPLAMKYAMRKVYVGLANGTLAIFRSNTSDHWNLVQPSILPLGRYPVAVLADVKDKLWCSSGSQIYVVSKKGDRIQRIIAVDSNMKNLVKHIVSCDVGVWVSVWKKAKIKLYHAETCEMMQEFNVVSPVVKMKNDVDSQVQYLSVDKISVTALLFIAGFLWVGTSVGLILLYPLPKMQGVPRVVGRACVAFHAHCGPVRSLLAIPQGCVGKDTMSDSVKSADEDANEINRKFSMLADSEESVASDEEFYFVDDKTPSSSPKKKKGGSSDIKHGGRQLKVSVKSSQLANLEDAAAELPFNADANPQDMNVIKPDDFARMMETFDGFKPERFSKTQNEKNVRSFQNKLFVATHPKNEEKRYDHEIVAIAGGDTNSGTNFPPGNMENERKPGKSNDEKESHKGSCDDADMINASTTDSNSGFVQSFPENSLGAAKVAMTGNATIMSTGELSEEVDALPLAGMGEQRIYENLPGQEKQDAGKVSQHAENKTNALLTQGEQKPSFREQAEHTATDYLDRQSLQISTCPKSNHQQSIADDVNHNSFASTAHIELSHSSQKQGEKGAEIMSLRRSSPQISRSNKSKREKIQNLSENFSKEIEKQPKSRSLNQVKNIKYVSLASGSPQISSNGNRQPAERDSDELTSSGNDQTYITVLPEKSNAKKLEGESNNDHADEGELETKAGWLNKTGKSRGKCTSYLVVSGGEGHVDLRLKVKSKQDMKKDAQTMFLIWRVSSKM